MEQEHVDVLIVGAGLSGIGSACHLVRNSPQKSFAIVEARDAVGGTWDLFRYPGIRSDSDMYTLGYSFRPWEEQKSIADGSSILKYINETAADHDLPETIRFGHKVVRYSWSSESALWTVDMERTDTGETVQMTCDFVLNCTGYYRYDGGFTPEFAGVDRFGGQVIHPQRWPEDLDYEGKRVVVIGSGATAVTLVPSMAEKAEHVTMLQRSPTYIVSLPAKDPIAHFFRRLLPTKAAYAASRWKNVAMTQLSYQLSKRAPKVMRAFFRKNVERNLPKGFDIDTHFNPSYDPWDQRVCLVPDGDLFKALSTGDASIVTDRIETFTETGLKLESGKELDADIIITATGLTLQALGGAQLVVDGREIDISETVGYKGMMLSGVPNMAIALGYTNASWTLKCDLVAQYVCRVLNHMDEHGYRQVTPLEPPASEPRHPFIDLTAGYVLRSIHTFPKQGDRAPWKLYQNYPRDIQLMKRGPLHDEGIEFSRGGVPAGAAEPVAA